MKKIFAITILGLAAAAASAQGMYDGLTYSDINYYGTARSIALGNAMTALGGDLGSIGINPAGSAVAGYSQITITPNISIGATTASYTPVGHTDFTATSNDSRTRFTLPNTGFVLEFNTGNNYGLKSFSFGALTNSTNVYLDRMSIAGTNTSTSMLGAIAASCKGIPSDKLKSYDSGYPWQDVLAFQTGMIATYLPDNDTQYIGASELVYDNDEIGIGGPLWQSYFKQHAGSKNDLVMNFGMNISDKFFAGVNLGVPYLNYSESINQLEEAVDPDDFFQKLDGSQTAFVAARERYSLEVDGTGIYAKVGFIWLPVNGLRIGAAIQTPTAMTITERWKWDGVCQFKGLSDNYGETPDAEYTYNLRTPAIFNVGLAYTIGSFGLVSADFERSNSRRMKFSNYDPEFGGNDDWYEVNNEIWNYAGATNNIRLGAEVKVVPEFALRAGYNYKCYSCPDYKDVTNSFSFGVGYSSAGSFFADAAVRSTLYPVSWYYPYDDYVQTRAPEVKLVKNLFDVVLTLGWRF